MGEHRPTSTLLINAGAVALVVIAMLVLIDPFDSEPNATPAGPHPEENAVEQTVTTFVTRSEPADCKFTYTQRFVDRAFDGSAEEAIARCQHRATGHDHQDGDEAMIEEVSIDDGRATVVTGTNGGLFDGSVHTLRLVRDAGSWKIDSVAAIKIDRERWDAANRNTWVENGFTAEEADCVIHQQKRTIETKELERTLLADYQGREIEGPDRKVLDCISAATLERKFSKQLWKAAAGSATPSFVDCVTSSLLDSMSPSELRRFIFLCEWPSPEVMERVFSGCRDARA